MEKSEESADPKVRNGPPLHTKGNWLPLKELCDTLVADNDVLEMFRRCYLSARTPRIAS